MSGLTVMKNGSRRIIIYTGEISDLPQKLHDLALKDPALEKAILTASTAISYTNKSKKIGEEMIDMVLYPQNR